MSASADLEEYRAAVATLRVAATSTQVGRLAQELVDELGPRSYDVPVPCIVCKDKYPFTTTIAGMAAWTDAPRGLCGKCAA